MVFFMATTWHVQKAERKSPCKHGLF